MNYKKLTKRNNMEQQKISNVNLSTSIYENISLVKKILSKNPTVVFRNFEIQVEYPIKCCMIFADEMANKELLNENILKPLMRVNLNSPVETNELLDFLVNKVINSSKLNKSEDMDELIGSILSGDAVLLIDGIVQALVIDSTGWSARAISEPTSESVVRGPREGLTESVKINLSLVRRRVKDPQLKFEFVTIGSKTNTKIAICYIEGIANEKILEELKNRLSAIKIDGILESGYIEELIKDNPYSPFKTVGSTERPDVIAGKILEGRIAILCDGTPFALTVPFIFIEYFQASEDYYNAYIYATFNRLIRILGFFISTSTPALYVSLVTFHHEMIPTPLFMSITAAREGTPFPTVVEALLMLFVFEIIREAGIRMPSTIGQAVSIVGALVLGDAAVAAKVISAPIVIVTAITGIGAFLLPKMLGPLVIIRILLLLFSSLLGLYGYIFGIIILFIHLMSIESFGVPYMTNANSFSKYEIQDAAVRAPWWYTYYNSVFISNKSKKPMKKGGGKS